MRLIISLLLLLCLSAPSAWAQSVPADLTAARIMVYFTIGRNNYPDTNVTKEQFQAHIKELSEGNYKVLPLYEIIRAYENKRRLPANTVALTFDGGDKSILTQAVPLLERHQIPYTVFLATARVDANDPRYLNWDDVRKMMKSPLVTFGLHPEKYNDISLGNEESIRSRLNNATARLREETQTNTMFFAYPFGEYTQNYKDIVSTYGFKAAFGQQSGVASIQADRFALPRFTMVEDFADADRFQMIATALPLPVKDVTPKTSHVSQSRPSIGFSVTQKIGDIKALSCFASGQKKPDINLVGEDRVELRLDQPITENRFRVNCTLPAEDDENPEHKRWRWFGFLMTKNTPPPEPQEEVTNDLTENRIED